MLLKKIKQVIKIIWILLKDRRMLLSLINNALFIKDKRKQNLIFICLVEHLGDIIAAEPIGQYIKRKKPDDEIVWITSEPYRELLHANSVINKVLTVTCLTEWIFLKMFYPPCNLYDLHIDGKCCTKYNFTIRNKNSHRINTNNYYDYGNLLFCFSRTAGLDIDSTVAPILNLPVKDLIKEKRYILLHTSSNESERLWNSKGWNELITFISNNYPDFYVKEIGLLKTVSIENRLYMDFTGKRTLNEIALLIKNCSLFIGVDSGFAHIANALKKKSVILIGHYQSFKKYIPYSGFLQEHSSDMLVHYDGELNNMPFSYIKEKIEECLNGIS